MTPETLTATTAQTLRPGPLVAASELAATLGAGALLVSSTPAVRWLGVAQPAGAHVLVSGGEALRLATLDELPVALAHIGLQLHDALALEHDALPLSVAAALGERPTTEAGAALTLIRARKDAEELALIEAAAELVKIGHAALREAARAGVGTTELHLWGAARAAIEAAKGRPLHAVVDLMAGKRTALIGVPPSGASVAADAPILFDLAPRHDGWWADSCATFAVGAPSAALRRLHDAARAALDVGIAKARPGMRARDLDAFVRSRLDEGGFDCPHHIGHGVGAAPQEEPWVDRGAPLVLEEGMVLALEPGAYRDGVGARVEHLLLIEADGARPLTSHSLSLT